MVIIVMGASGAGKTTVGRTLATRLAWTFIDADDFHSPEHVERMRHGVPLTDDDRQPWLKRVHEAIAVAADGAPGVVVACSALRERYRSVLAGAIHSVALVFLDATAELLHERLARRQGHFMPESLVDSQLAVLERPAGAVTVDAALPLDVQVATIRQALGL